MLISQKAIVTTIDDDDGDGDDDNVNSNKVDCEGAQMSASTDSSEKKFSCRRKL